MTAEEQWNFRKTTCEQDGMLDYCGYFAGHIRNPVEYNQLKEAFRRGCINNGRACGIWRGLIESSSIAIQQAQKDRDTFWSDIASLCEKGNDNVCVYHYIYQLFRKEKLKDPVRACAVISRACSQGLDYACGWERSKSCGGDWRH